MSLYGWVLFLSGILPIIFSFQSQINFYRKWGRTLLSIVIVAMPFWVWDAVATQRGDWSFNPAYVGGTKIAGLPIEEILFFGVIPFCCLFIWQIVEKKITDRKIKITKKSTSIIAIIAILLALLLRDKFYTTTVLWWSVVTLVMVNRLDKNLFQKANYWKWIAITFIPFLVVNGILTYLPVVEYSSQAITGLRLVTIPIEDFGYSWCLLTLNLVVYNKLRR